MTKDDVPGRISEARFCSFWKDTLLAPDFILKSLQHGYTIPLREFLPEAHLRHNSSGRDPENQDFLDDEFSYLERVGAISEVKKKPHLCHPIQVASPPGRKKRPIVDASRSLNPHIVERKATLDHLAVVLHQLSPDCWFAMSDI